MSWLKVSVRAPETLEGLRAQGRRRRHARRVAARRVVPRRSFFLFFLLFLYDNISRNHGSTCLGFYVSSFSDDSSFSISTGSGPTTACACCACNLSITKNW